MQTWTLDLKTEGKATLSPPEDAAGAASKPDIIVQVADAVGGPGCVWIAASLLM